MTAKDVLGYLRKFHIAKMALMAELVELVEMADMRSKSIMF